eukprot:1403439-Amphidinium_carterae.1
MKAPANSHTLFVVLLLKLMLTEISFALMLVFMAPVNKTQHDSSSPFGFPLPTSFCSAFKIWGAHTRPTERA